MTRWRKKNNFQNNLRTIEARIVTKLRNNEPRPKLTGVCSFENIGGGGGAKAPTPTPANSSKFCVIFYICVDLPKIDLNSSHSITATRHLAGSR